MMKLAREFGRPDWRAMLSGLSSTELKEWADYFSETFFTHSQIDAHFASLEHLIVSMRLPKHNKSIADFSLLSMAEKSAMAVNDEGMSDDQIMMAAEGLSGGLRFGPE